MGPTGRGSARRIRRLTGQEATTRAVERLFRDERRAIVATTIRICGGDFETAEDVVQEAFEAALTLWPKEGIPPNPAGWVTITARRKAIDRMRRSRSFVKKEDRIRESRHSWSPSVDVEKVTEPVRDDELRLVFTCCHPALSTEAQVALTLKVVGGLTTAQIARSFISPTATIAQRIVRAKRKIRDAGIPYEVPGEDELQARVATVLAVVYLIFNEGYSSTDSEQLVTTHLTREAIRLGRLVVELVPGHPEAQGLLALMTIHDARKDGRTGPNGELIPLEQQDRSLWNRPQIALGRAILDRALRHRVLGPYQLQAAIAAEHALAPSTEETNWARIEGHYHRLAAIMENPVVDLNRAVAVAMARGPEAGLELMEDLGDDPRMARYHLFHAARADLYRRLGQWDASRVAYRQAIDLCQSPVEITYLEARLEEVSQDTDTD